MSVVERVAVVAALAVGDETGCLRTGYLQAFSRIFEVSIFTKINSSLCFSKYFVFHSRLKLSFESFC